MRIKENGEAEKDMYKSSSDRSEEVQPVRGLGLRLTRIDKQNMFSCPQHREKALIAMMNW